MHPILACGAELKNTFCLTKGHYAILSQHIGDLENYETLLFFEETLKSKEIVSVEPAMVAYDLHPQYMSTRFALQTGLKSRSECSTIMLTSPVAWRRTALRSRNRRGIRRDRLRNRRQNLGGEFLVADFSGFERRAHFRYIPLAGGDAAVRQPWRPP